MLILALDTSSPAGNFAVLRDYNILARSVSSGDEPYSTSVLRDARALLSGVCISLEEIDLFAVDAGPGSFTGLRVGLTMVKGWAEVWRKPTVAVSGLEATTAQISPWPEAGSLVAAVIDARRGQLFGGTFRARSGAGLLEPIGEEIVATADEFVDRLQRDFAGGQVIVACARRELIQPAMEGKGLCGRIEIVPGMLAPAIGQIAYAKALRGEVVDALHLDANYIRRSDAEMNWKAG